MIGVTAGATPSGWRRSAAALTIATAAVAWTATAQAVDPAVVEAARNEGKVVWLTTQIVDELAQPLADAFKSAYGIEVSVRRANPRQIVERVTEAARSGRGSIDVIDGRSTIPPLKRAGLLAPLDLEAARRLPSQLMDRDGYWVASNLFMSTMAFNPELVGEAERPRTLDDLLRPEWSGRMVWSANAAISAAPGFIGTVLRDKGSVEGRAYLEKLGVQQIAGYEVASRQVIDKVVARKFPIALQVFNHQVAVSAGRGAPIAWSPVAPATGSVAAAAIARHAPHPNAARLFVEFLVSRQGQEIFREADYLPAAPDVPPKDTTLTPAGGKFSAITFTPEEIEAELPTWIAIYNELFR